jgi:hypothetical protein
MMVTGTDLIVADYSRSAQGRVHFINAQAAHARHRARGTSAQRRALDAARLVGVATGRGAASHLSSLHHNIALCML